MMHLASVDRACGGAHAWCICIHGSPLPLQRICHHRQRLPLVLLGAAWSLVYRCCFVLVLRVLLELQSITLNLCEQANKHQLSPASAASLAAFIARNC